MLSLGGSAQQKDAKKQPPPDPVKLIDQAIQEWKNVKTFRAIFMRRERLKGADKLYPQQVIFMRARKKPFSIYMRWIDKENEGRECAYIEGRNDGRFRAKLGGLAGLITVSRDPNAPMVYKYSRHTILEAGIWHLLDTLKTRFTSAAGDARTFYKGIHKFEGRDTYKFYRYLPEKKDKDGNHVYYCWKVELWIDVQTKLPVVLRLYDYDKKLFEEYMYRDVVKDPPYTDEYFQLGKTED